MADNYSWSDANSKGYKTGNYDGVAGKIVPITRNTVADGDLLNSNIVEVVSSRDEYLYDSLTQLNSLVDTTVDIVESNSADWDNTKLIGFSAISADKQTIKAAENNTDLIINLSGAIEASKNSDNTFDLKPADYLTDSYWQKTIRNGTPEPFLPHNNLETAPSGGGAIFGGALSHCKLNGHVENNAFVFNVLNPSKSEAYLEFGSDVLLNGSYKIESTKGVLAINHSFGSQNAYAASNSYAKDNAVALFSSSAQSYNPIAMFNSTATGSCISFVNSTAYGNAVSMFSSYASEASVAMYSAYAYSCGMALYNAKAGANTLALYDSTGNQHGFDVSLHASDTKAPLSLAAYNSFVTDGVGGSCALIDSSAYNRGLSFYKSCISSLGVAIVNSTAINESFAFNASHAENFSTSLEQSVAKQQSFAFKLSNAQNASVAMFNSVADNDSLAAFDSSAKYSVFAMFNSIDDNSNTGFAIFSSVNSKIQGDSYATTTAQHSFASHNSVNGYNGSKEYKLMYEEYQKPTTRVSFVDAVTDSLSRFNSSACGDFALTYYNSLNVFSDFSITMYDSYVNSTEGVASKRADGTYGLKSSKASNVIALYNSNVTDDSFKIKLWNNQITIEPLGFINKVKYVDLSIPSNYKFVYDIEEYGPLLADGYTMVLIG